MKKTLVLAVVCACIFCMTACSQTPLPSEEAPTDILEKPTPGYTFSPIVTPPQATLAPEPTDFPNEIPGSDDYYIYTLDMGDGKYPYAWTQQCPVSGEIKYGTTGSAEVKAVQQRLTQLGFYCGGVTGTFNSKMLAAINDFQLAVGLDKTTDLTQETIDILYSPDGIEAMSIEEYYIPEGILDGVTVFVDAGHGGSATGTARNSLVEKTNVIETSYRLKAMLENAGARVIMTRSSESNISLTYRSALVNDVILSDLSAQTSRRIAEIDSDIAIIGTLDKMSTSEIIKRAQDLLESINSMLVPLAEIQQYVENTINEFGKISAEYSEALKQKNELEQNADKLYKEYELVMQMYYHQQMNVDTNIYIESYNAERKELVEYRDKLEYYRSLLQVNLNAPDEEFMGLWKKTYDENGYKVIEPELKNIFDLMNETCTNQYIFISVHVNGVDNAEHVSGTEIYVRNINSTNNNYSGNRYYYSDYNIAQRSIFASCVKNAMDEVSPLQNGKAVVVKDSDLWVLREINIPCILLETGYVTNEYDRIMLQKPQTRNAFAYALYKSVCNFYLG